MGLKRTTAPAREPVDKEVVDLALRYTEGSLDNEIQELIKSATADAEDYTGRAFITQTWTLTLDRFPPVIHLPRPPLQSVSSINYIDSGGNTKLLAAADYRVTQNSDSGRITPAYNKSWPTTRTVTEAITIEFVAGYGAAPSDVPAAARRAIILTVGEWFNVMGHSTERERKPIPLNAIWLLNKLKAGRHAAWIETTS